MADPTLFILNGPNLNLLGEREPQVYGRTTLPEIEAACRARAAARGLALDFRQTNHEGVLVEAVHEARTAAAGLIVNPAGFSFTSIALLDALKMYDGPKIELHITNIHAREEIYHRSLVSRAVTAVIAGLGAGGYGVAIDAIGMLLDERRA
ncbi:MAG: 3-dehydroquinate dehydratase [Methylobacteriaceae bacterium]|nr:3-dehydroquinate dehydratase [Methylobacteriaceae bacterium]